MGRSELVCAVVVAALMAGGCHDGPGLHGGHRAPPPGGEATMTLQPGAAEWKASPQLQEYYEATKAAFANGPDAVDIGAYEVRSREIFIALADATGASREEMLDHLKDIPGQVVRIVREDPSVLDSYEAFWVALAGPD